MFRHFSRPLAVWLALSAAAMAQAVEQEPRFLSPKAASGRLLLAAPPSKGSEEYQAEIEEILVIQAHRSDAQIARFHSQETLGLTAFKDIMPDWFAGDDMPKLNKLFKRVAKESGGPVDAAKAYFKRPRPFREDSRIQPLGRRDEEFAYPSGHSTRGILYAQFLAQLAPEKSAALMERGREIGWNRVIGGMHHPSDIAAGRVLGQAIARAMFRSEDFHVELEKVKQEYKAAKEKHAAAVSAK